MFKPGPEWLIVLLLVVLLIFGAKRLPEIGSSLGRGLRAFKSSVMGEDENKQPDEQSANSRTDEDRP